jgi:hypothetical protein
MQTLQTRLHTKIYCFVHKMDALNVHPFQQKFILYNKMMEIDPNMI